MYQLPAALPVDEFDAGTNVLLAGPKSATRNLAFDALVAGSPGGQGHIVVTTTRAGEDVLTELEPTIGSDEGTVGVVDCASNRAGLGAVGDDARVRYASSPTDLTGIGIELSSLLEEFQAQHDREGIRVLLDSVTSLLEAGDVQTVFRFLHVFTGRVVNAEALGLYVLDPSATDDQNLRTLYQLFDVVLEVTPGADGRPIVNRHVPA